MDWIELEAYQKRAGISNIEIADKLKISPASYYRKKHGITDFYREEIQQIALLLGLNSHEVERIFFTN